MILHIDLKYAGAAALIAQSVCAKIIWTVVEQSYVSVWLDDDLLASQKFRNACEHHGLMCKVE